MSILNDNSLPPKERNEKYSSYYSYDEMMRKFWIWDFEKFRRR